MTVESFVFYRSFYEAIKDLPDKEQLDLFKAICEYALDHKERKLENPLANGMLTLIKPQLDANYKRKQDGAKGGRPKTSKSAETEDSDVRNHRLPKEKTTGYANEKPNVNVNVNVNDNANEEYILAPTSDEIEAVAKLPLNVNGTFYTVTSDDVNHYQELYPGVNVEQELRNMVGWLESNPSKRKTKSGAPRFITNWLSKQQNRGGSTTNTRGGIPFFDID